MVNETRFIGKKHQDFELAKMFFSRLEDKQVVALLGERYLKYVYHREFTHQKISEYLEIDIRVFRHNKKRVKSILKQHFGYIDQYERLKL
jgi:hypothetical protein